MNTNTLMRDENTVKIEWTDDIGSPVMVDGAPVPSARFWEAIIDGVSEDKAVKLAVDSAVYRTELKRVYVVTDRVKTTDTVGVRGKDFTLVERTEETRVRPFAVGAMARFEVTPTPCSMMALFYYAKETHGHCPVAMVDKKVFFAKEEQQSRLLNRFGIKGGMKDNAHLLVRMGVLMKRPG